MNPPPVTEFERNCNVTVLQHELHGQMKCFAGKNKVYLRSVLQEDGRRTRPRIALKCALRAEFGMKRHVYYEYIRDVCCGNPSRCPAYRKFLEQNPEAARAYNGGTGADGTNGTPGTGGYRPPTRPVL